MHSPDSPEQLSSKTQQPAGEPAGAPARKHWAVVGGGMLGLATAWRLAERGEKVTVLEAASELGGLTSAWTLGDTSWDRFYHVTLLSDTRLRALLDEIGLEKEIRWVQTRTGFFSGGKLYSLSSSFDFLKFPPLSLWQKFRLGSTIFYASKLRDWKALERIPVDKWLRKLSGKSTFEKIWLPLLKAKLGEAYQRTSAAFIWSYIDRMYKARRSGMKREMFGYVPGGYRRILQVLGAALESRGSSIATSSPVTKVVRDEGTNQLLVTCGKGANERIERFDRVVMTAPSPIVDKACEGLNAQERQRLNGAEYLGVVCTSLLLDRPLAGYYVTNIIDTWVPLTGIIEMGAIVDPQYLNGHYLVYLPRYLMANDPGFEESDEAIHERCLATLERMYPNFNRSQVSAIQTARARHVMALPTLRYSEQLPPVVCSVPGLYLLNSAQVTKGNLNVNETIEIVERELERSVWPDSQANLSQHKAPKSVDLAAV
ncbi:MAG: NAD(P)/FAD-dependent oxidoreductase [Pirellulaceae bacterium]|nr:NAD(P)/FAD-dependent oxidoreductase [Pirellulaceae bacterium]